MLVYEKVFLVVLWTENSDWILQTAIIKLFADQSEVGALHLWCQYKLLYTILNNIEVYEEPVPRTKKIPYYVVEFKAGEENRIV